MLCDDCIYNISEEEFKCSILPLKKPRKKMCTCHADKEHEMPGDMFWDQPAEDFTDFTDEDLKKVYPNKWKEVRKRIDEILRG